MIDGFMQVLLSGLRILKMSRQMRKLLFLVFASKDQSLFEICIYLGFNIFFKIFYCHTFFVLFFNLYMYIKAMSCKCGYFYKKVKFVFYLLWNHLNLWVPIFVDCEFIAYLWGCNFVDASVFMQFQ